MASNVHSLQSLVVARPRGRRGFVVATFALAGIVGCGGTEGSSDPEIIGQTASAVVDHLAVPAAYDNATKPYVWGQTFVAADPSFGGVRIYIGDPTRPDNEAVNGLQGPADLVLFDVSDITQPRRLGEEPFLPRGATAFGLTTIALDVPLRTVAGKKYFFGIDACDDFGLGLRALEQSTYPDGAEATLSRATGVIGENPLGRDLAFEVFPGRGRGPFHPTASHFLPGYGEHHEPRPCQ